MPAGIDEHFAERVQLFHGHGKLFAQQVHQAGNARRASRYHNALDAFAAGRGPEEVKRLLDFQCKNVRNAAQDLLLLLVGYARQRIAPLQALRILEAQVQFLLQCVGVLVAAECRRARY